jgi:hypothetical protein
MRGRGDGERMLGKQGIMEEMNGGAKQDWKKGIEQESQMETHGDRGRHFMEPDIPFSLYEFEEGDRITWPYIHNRNTEASVDNERARRLVKLDVDSD